MPIRVICIIKCITWCCMYGMSLYSFFNWTQLCSVIDKKCFGEKKNYIYHFKATLDNKHAARGTWTTTAHNPNRNDTQEWQHVRPLGHIVIWQIKRLVLSFIVLLMRMKSVNCTVYHSYKMVQNKLYSAL